MAEKDEGLTMYQIITAILTIVGLAIAIYTIWVKLKETEPPNSGGWVPPDEPPDEPPEDGPIEGTLQQWGYTYGNSPDEIPTKTVLWNFGKVVHLSSITGLATINNDSQEWFEKKVGFQIYATRSGIQGNIKIGEYYPFGGYGDEVVPFNNSVGIDDVTGVFWVINRYYGFGYDVRRFFNIGCEAFVVVKN